MRSSTRQLEPCFLLAVLFALPLSVCGVRGPEVAVADPEDDLARKEAKEQKERYTRWMQNYAESTTIRVTDAKGDKEQDAKLVSHPVIRYRDPIIADDATLWLWTVDSRPVALQKIEVNNNGGGQKWTICFASVAQGIVTAQWPGDRRYASTAPGLKFRPIPEAKPPSNNPKFRMAQIKTLKTRFTGLVGYTVERNEGIELTPMTTPLFDYSDPESKLPLGAIFCLVDEKGVRNPGVLLFIEARPDDDGKWRWEFACAKLGKAGAKWRLDGDEVLMIPAVRTGQVFDNWTFFVMPRDFK
jgi:hypothetical protein